MSVIHQLYWKYWVKPKVWPQLLQKSCSQLESILSSYELNDFEIMELVPIYGSEDYFWESLLLHQKLSSTLLDTYGAKLAQYPYTLVYSEVLSESFIEKFLLHNDLALVECTCSQKLSEEFLERHANRINWYYVIENQELSEEFVLRHMSYIVKTWDSGPAGLDNFLEICRACGYNVPRLRESFEMLSLLN